MQAAQTDQSNWFWFAVLLCLLYDAFSGIFLSRRFVIVKTSKVPVQNA